MRGEREIDTGSRPQTSRGHGDAYGEGGHDVALLACEALFGKERGGEVRALIEDLSGGTCPCVAVTGASCPLVGLADGDC